MWIITYRHIAMSWNVTFIQYSFCILVGKYRKCFLILVVVSSTCIRVGNNTGWNWCRIRIRIVILTEYSKGIGTSGARCRRYDGWFCILFVYGKLHWGYNIHFDAWFYRTWCFVVIIMEYIKCHTGRYVIVVGR